MSYEPLAAIMPKLNSEEVSRLREMIKEAEAEAYKEGYIQSIKDRATASIDAMTSEVTRFEAIDHTKSLEDGGGRALVEYDVDVELSFQDEGRTLKVFLKRENAPSEDEAKSAVG